MNGDPAVRLINPILPKESSVLSLPPELQAQAANRLSWLALIYAATFALAFFLIWLNSGQPPFPQGIRLAHMVLWSSANFICAGMAYVGARIIYRLGTEVARERELGSYQLDSQIGQGGMGEVWQARHRMLIRPAATKLIRPDRLVCQMLEAEYPDPISFAGRCAFPRPSKAALKQMGCRTVGVPTLYKSQLGYSEILCLARVSFTLEPVL